MGIPQDISRRSVLGALVGSGAALAFGCGSSSTSKATSGAGGAGGAGGSGTTSTTTGTCAVTPEGEIGPYFADDSATGFNRSNIVANIDGTEPQTGIPLTLSVTVLDSEKDCAAYVGAQIDIWHCNAAGVYSDQASESTSTKSWLRGYQITDANGQVTFVTVIPGWYSGRTTHIHLRVRSSYSEASSTSDGTNTTQVFFDQTFIDSLATSVAPYDTEGTNPTTNAGDRVYAQQTLGEMQMTLTGDNTSGYAASVTIRLPITTETDGGTTMGIPDGGMGGPPDGGMGGGPPDGG
jgi:protocatechuate 3,4-dioxygenase beta subunit